MVLPANGMRKIKTFGIRYDGSYGADLHSWTDLKTHGSFTTSGLDLDAAIRKARGVRRRLKLFPTTRDRQPGRGSKHSRV